MHCLKGGGVRSQSAGVGFPGALESSEASGLSLLRQFLALPRPQSIRHLPPPFTRGRRHSPRPQILDAEHMSLFLVMIKGGLNMVNQYGSSFIIEVPEVGWPVCTFSWPVAATPLIVGAVA
ncbi:hypothetical protein KSP40_PGU017650 [Platanthera guangdongensis]|uniref:Uncharacterized protein n=1 Tax=Platanthera guangdongensis TaxID=2320717 RepID=A0ABR2MYV7_9ASPA